MTWQDAVLPTAILLMAGTIKGVIGLGLPAVSVGVLGLFMPPVQAAAILVVPSIVTNIWQGVAGAQFARVLRRIWPLLVGVLVGAWLGSGSLSANGSGHARFWLGIVLAVYGVYGLLGRRLVVPPHWEIWLAPLVGVVTGAVTTTTGVSTMPLIIYLAGLERFERGEVVQALGITFTLCSLCLGSDLLGRSQFDNTLLIATCLAVIPALVGMQFGQMVARRISPLLFRRCFFSGMVLLGVQLARH